MITEYTHYGAKIEYQHIEFDGQFEKELQKKGIDFTYLPVSPDNEIRNNVIKYSIDNIKKYALMVDSHCFITEEVPEDGNWYGIYEDVRDQFRGEEPRKMPSKARQVLDKAEELAREEKQGKIEAKREEYSNLFGW